MRIIGGTFRGKKLHPVKLDGIRPTADRIRESVFNILGSLAEYQSVLDLYSGTGALGLEALSRGVAHVCFIEKNPKAIDLIRKNLKSCGLDSRAEVIRWDIEKNLNCLNASTRRYDLIFMDPPYNKSLVGKALSHLHASGCALPGAIVVAEHSATEAFTADATIWSLVDQRRYGRTRISFFSHS